jgi:hypothetical protein
MSKNSTFVDMAIHGGIPFGSASGAAPELRDERSGGIFWPMGAGQACRRPVWTAPYGHFQCVPGAGQGFRGDFQPIFSLFTHGNIRLSVTKQASRATGMNQPSMAMQSHSQPSRPSLFH